MGTIAPAAWLAPLTLASLIAPAAAAQQATPLLVEGDRIGGVPVFRFEPARLADDGGWLAIVRENAPVAVGLLLRDGVPILAEGQRLASPSALVTRLNGIAGAGANAAVLLTLNNFVPPRPGPVAGLLRGDRLVLLTNELLDVAGLPPETRTGPIESVGANAQGTLLAVVRVGAPDDLALVRFEFAADGTPLARELVLRSGQLLPDGSIAAGFAPPALDESGAWLVRVRTSDGADHLLAGSRQLLASGDPSPLPGRPLAAVLPSYDRNDHGGYAAVVRLAGDPSSDLALLVNGALLAQEGMLVPSLSALVPPAPLIGFGQVRLSNSGQAYWQALTLAGSFGPGSCMRDGLPFLQAGVSLVGGELVVRMAGSADNFEISPSGRFWLGRVLLEQSGEAYVLADFGAAEPLGGCVPNAGTLRLSDGLVLAGATIELTLDGPAVPGSLTRLHFSLQRAPTGTACGLPTPFGEILLDPRTRLASLPAGVFASAPVRLSLALPPLVGLVDLELFAQGSFHAPLGGILLTNGLRLEIGAP